MSIAQTFRSSLPDVRLTTLFVFLFLVALSTGCQTQGTSDARAGDEAALKKLDDEWSKAMESRDVEKTISYYSDDAMVMLPNIPALTGKESIRSFWNSMLDRSFSGGWTATKVEVSGNLAYVTGNYEFKDSDGSDKPMADKGKYFAVWKKQADGSWKCVADVFSSDIPVPVPARD
jgi:ketosteroid isomerase-like protein